MKWDATNIYFYQTNYTSAPLTIKKVERTKITLPTLETQDCYLVEIMEDVIYRKGVSKETFPSKNFFVFEYTYENRGKAISRDENGAIYDVFYYFVHYLGKKIDKGIPFRKYWFSNNFEHRIFCLSDDFGDQKKDINTIIKREKKKWDATGYADKKDLKIENKAIVDAKWDFQREKEKTNEKIKDLETQLNQTKEENTSLDTQVRDLQEKLAEKEQNIINLNAQVENLKKQIESNQVSYRQTEEQKKKEKQALEEKISQLWQEAKSNLNDYIKLMKDEIEEEDLDEKEKRPFEEKIKQVESFINSNQEIEKECQAKVVQVQPFVSNQGGTK